MNQIAMSYNVTLNKKLPEQGVYDQLLGGHIVNRKQIKLYPRSGSGTYGPTAQQNIQFRLPSHGYIDCLRSYMTYTLNVISPLTTHNVNRSANPPDILYGDDTVQNTNLFRRVLYRGAITTPNANNTDNLTNAPIPFGPAYYDRTNHAPEQNRGVQRDSLAYILGGHNGSTASPFRLFRFLYDGEPIEYIDNYNGLAAKLSMNISEGYRRSALGNMQFLSPRGPREMILNALSRGGSEVLIGGEDTALNVVPDDTAPPNYYGWNGRGPVAYDSNGIKTYKDNVGVTTTYKDLMHMPLSGILGNSKLLPVKFLGNLDIEFSLAPTTDVLMVASAFAANTLVSTHVGAVITGPQKLTFRRHGAPRRNGDAAAAVHVTRWGDFLNDNDINYTLLHYVSNVLSNGYRRNDDAATDGAGDLQFDPDANAPNNRLGEMFVLKDRDLNDIRYEITEPVYHMEVVYMSEAYDAAFADALTRGVTYSFETYTATNAPVHGDGAVHVPISKTSIKGAFAGFINTHMKSILSNSWHFINPDLKEYQLKFGAKLVPQEPMKVDADKGLQSLMMYLKAVNMHYNPMAGFHYNWVRSDTSQQKTHGPLSGESNSTVAFGTLGCSEPGQATWCYNSGDISSGDNDLKRVFGKAYPTTCGPDQVDVANNDSWIANHSVSQSYAEVADVNNLQRNLAITTWEYNVGSFSLGLDLETEQDALSGINTAGSTAALQWVFKFCDTMHKEMTLYTWVLHDKALRFEPYGRMTVIVD